MEMRRMIMKDEYDFSKAKKNPYAKQLKQQVTINLDSSIIDYFKEMAAVSGVPYQTLINMYLSDCVKSRRKIQISWQ